MRGCTRYSPMRQGRARADIPIIAMTANAFEDVRERIFDAGMGRLSRQAGRAGQAGLRSDSRSQNKKGRLTARKIKS